VCTLKPFTKAAVQQRLGMPSPPGRAQPNRHEGLRRTGLQAALVEALQLDNLGLEGGRGDADLAQVEIGRSMLICR
jgi:hypothetical protein